MDPSHIWCWCRSFLSPQFEEKDRHEEELESKIFTILMSGIQLEWVVAVGAGLAVGLVGLVGCGVVEGPHLVGNHCLASQQVVVHMGFRSGEVFKLEGFSR